MTSEELINELDDVCTLLSTILDKMSSVEDKVVVGHENEGVVAHAIRDWMAVNMKKTVIRTAWGLLYSELVLMQSANKEKQRVE